MAPRDLYLINGFWGETYRRWFVDFFLRSVLAPGNVAALDPRASNKLLLATTPADWEEIRHHPAVLAVQNHLEIVFYPIPVLDDRHGTKFAKETYYHVGSAYAPLLARACADRALGIMLSPDLMLSDGILLASRRRLERGANLVFIPAWRSDETKLMHRLREVGVLPKPEDGDRRSGDPLILPNRMLASAMAISIHKLETLRFWQDNTYHEVPSYSFWRVSNNGLVMFGMSGVPFVDYAHVSQHDVSGLARDGLDAYPSMFRLDQPRVEMITDTDEGCLASWTPTAAESWVSYRKRWRLMIPGLRNFARRGILRAYAQHVFVWGRNRYNWLVYPQPIRLHSQDIDENWLVIENHARRLISSAVGDLFPVGAFGEKPGMPVGRPWHPAWIPIRIGAFVFAFEQVAHRNLAFAWLVARLVVRGLFGKREARARLLHRIGLRCKKLLADKQRDADAA